MSKEELFYIDKETGFLVFTEAYHLKRGYCCGSNCRHCPFDHINVPSKRSIKPDSLDGVDPANKD